MEHDFIAYLGDLTLPPRRSHVAQGYVLFQTVQLADAGLSTQVRSTLFEDLIFGQVSK